MSLSMKMQNSSSMIRQALADLIQHALKRLQPGIWHIFWYIHLCDSSAIGSKSFTVQLFYMKRLSPTQQKRLHISMLISDWIPTTWCILRDAQLLRSVPVASSYSKTQHMYAMRVITSPHLRQWISHISQPKKTGSKDDSQHRCGIIDAPPWFVQFDSPWQHDKNLIEILLH